MITNEFDMADIQKDDRVEVYYVYDGNFCIRTFDKENVAQWIDFIIFKGGVPRVELKREDY